MDAYGAEIAVPATHAIDLQRPYGRIAGRISTWQVTRSHDFRVIAPLTFVNKVPLRVALLLCSWQIDPDPRTEAVVRIIAVLTS